MKMYALVATFTTAMAGAAVDSSASFGATASFAPVSASADATASADIQARQFLFANPAADALALQALKPNATNPLSTILLASAINGNANNNQYYGGGYPSYGGGYPPYPAYPSYSYGGGYPSYGGSFGGYYGSPYPSYSPSYPGYPPSYPSYSSYPPSWGQSSYPNPPNDPLKQAVILNGIQQGTINPITAVGLDRNPGVSPLSAQLFANAGDSPLSTVLAVNGGFGGSNYYSPYGGTVFGGNSLGQYFYYNQVINGGTGFGR